VNIKDIADRLGSKATSLASLASLRLENVVARTKADLLEVARWLDLKGASKMRKEELARCIVEQLKARVEKVRAGGVAARLASKVPLKAAAKPPANAIAKPPAKATAKPPPKAVAKPPPKAAAKPPSKVVAKSPAKDSSPAPSRTVSKEPTRTPEATPAVDSAAGEDPGATAKLDIGPAGKAEKPVAHIPWSYDLDRVVAAAVDPDRLFVWWEVTDPAIEKARASLGSTGAHAALVLRVHDTTGLLFDGTNAHSWFDHAVERSDRQWFFQIGKPTSSAHVEVGLVAPGGAFARIARSRRVDFPRKQPAPWREPEWLTVIPGSGDVRHAGSGAPGQPPAPDASGGPGAPAGPWARAGGEAPPPPFEPIALWRLHESGANREARIVELLSAGWHRVEWREVEGEGWYELSGRAEWMEPLQRSSWEAGPFAYPVEVEPPSREEWRGPAVAFQVGGVTHLVYGPWQVVIRNLDAFAEHAVLARWEMYRSWVAEGGREGRGALPTASRPAPGASENLGGSETLWLRGSELRLGGASERWRLGASELRLGGASELLAAGGSERRLGGASELRFQGASEWRLGGASERVLGGASERQLAGGSEHRLGGGSEDRLGGASERTQPVKPGPYPTFED
jgi:hypothetical protein